MDSTVTEQTFDGFEYVAVNKTTSRYSFVNVAGLAIQPFDAVTSE